MIIFLGLLVGFIAAVPIGPLNIFVISQALKHDFLHSFLPGLTASFLDVIYCFAAIKGISYASVTLTRFGSLMKFIGAVLFTAISIQLIKQSKIPDEKTFVRRSTNNTYSRPILTAFFLYVSNPTLYVFWLAAAGMLTAHQWVTNVGWHPFVFALSCGAGSIMWYIMLIKYVLKHNHKIKPKTFRKIIVGLAVILIGFALYSLATLFY